MDSFDVTVTVEPEYLRVSTVGEYAFNELFEFLERVNREAQQVDKNRVLIDSRLLRGQMTESERFRGGQKIAELFGGRIKIALLMPAEGITKLGELTAANRGARFLVSDSEPEALSWLLA